MVKLQKAFSKKLGSSKFRAPDCAMGSLPAFDIRSKREGVKIRWMVSDQFICSPGLLQRSVQRSFWFFSRSSHSSTSCPQPLQAVWRRVRHTFGHAPPSRQPLLDPNHGDGGKPDYRLVPEPPLQSSDTMRSNGQEKWFEKPWFLQVENFLL